MVYAFAENGTVFVTVSKEHEPKCSIKMPRPLKKEECGELYELYLRRKKGEHISGEATAATRNQVYWYGIFPIWGCRYREGEHKWQRREQPAQI